MRKLYLTNLLLFLFYLPLSTFAGDLILEVIPLEHRLTDDVIPILRPLIAPGGTITGMNNQLIVKTTAENMVEIKSLLDSLDRLPRRLLITVKQDIAGKIYSTDHSLSGNYSSGDVSAGVREPGHLRDGLVISGSDDDGDVIRYRNQNTAINTDDRNTFTVQATEGYPAFINSGQSLPVTGRTAYVTPGGVVINDSTEYIDASSGFYVLPRLNGDLVTLLIAPQLTRMEPGHAPVFDVQHVETTATGRLGEWIELGGINQQFSNSNHEILSSSSAHGSEQRSIYVKVIEIE